MKNLTLRLRACLKTTLSLIAACMACATAGRAQNYEVLHSFANLTGYGLTTPLVQGPDATLYGTTSTGGSGNSGVVFRVQPNGTGYTVLKTFSFADPVTFTNVGGAYPAGGLVLSGTNLYGTTYEGGPSGSGTVFTLSTNGSGFTTLWNFSARDPVTGTNRDGAAPEAGLILTNNVVYGTTYAGGNSTLGTAFSLNITNLGFTNLHNFTGGTDGGNPQSVLVLGGQTLYGTASDGGPGDNGAIFKVNTDGSAFAAIYTFTNGTDGSTPQAGVTLAGGVLYGTTYGGGSGDSGTLFSVATNGMGFLTLANFTALNSQTGTNSNGAHPTSQLVVADGAIYGATSVGGPFASGTLFAIPAGGGGLSTLHVFTGEDDGASPFGGLILSGGILYGTTYNGGVAGEGNIFEISASGLGFGTVYNFNAASDGSLPLGGVVVSGGALYGTTQDGGTFNSGMIYKVNLDGTGFSVLEDFPALDPASGTNTGGANPTASMVLFDGILYGTAQNGGDSGTGTIFAINTNGIGFAALTNFPPTDLLTGRNLDGANPASGLILSGNTLYGTTSAGGANDTGTLFQLQTSGAGFQTLANFSNQVTAGLSLSGGTLYGITPNGGANGFGSVFAINTDGSAFHILYSFAGASDGANPAGRLVVGNDTLYGTTPFGGAGGNGTVFSVKTNGGGFHVLKSFTAVDPRTGNNFDGAEPQAGVVLSNGALYGTTLFGGSAGDGTIFSVNTSNGAFTVLKSFAIVGYSNGRGTQGNPVNAGGAFAAADLILANGTLYGAAQTGGFAGDGTVFALTTPVQLTIALQGSQVILTWNDPTYLLQSAPTVNGTYATLTTATSPYTTTPSGAQQFFRLLAP